MIDFFNWLPDAFQVTVRARYEPWRVMPNIGIAVGENTNCGRITPSSLYL
ncbi:hypothetical protein ACFLSV_06930 [Bacteroidota bacterium]